MTIEDGLNPGFNSNRQVLQIISLQDLFAQLVQCNEQHLEP